MAAADRSHVDEVSKVDAPRRLEEDEIQRLRALNRRWWGATFAAVVVVLGVFVAAGVLWLWSVVKDSPTIS